MRMRTHWIPGLLLGAALLVACPPGIAQTTDDSATAGDIQQETRELLDALASYGADQRDKAVEKTAAAMEALDKRIDTLQQRIDDNWDDMSAAARQKSRESLKALRKQRIAVAEWYGALKSGSADAWERIKTGFSDAYEAFTDAWRSTDTDLGSAE